MITAVLFTIPSRYWYTIGRQLVFSLIPWSGQIHATFHVCCATQELPRAILDFGYGSVTLFGSTFQKIHLSSEVPHRGPTTPEPKTLVWAVPLSLATTDGITSFSFPPVTEMFHFTGCRVSFPILFRKERYRIKGIRLPHSEISGSSACVRLTEAYRSLSRPSSLPDAKASTMSP